ncbi:hypothetical protein chiPu_0011451 [Chiloscyllium punctatum]|uniref:Uncharacterized protein n=1 Tax=Chiloscyllium punctatum TaxID=137246 RepID=A0A401SRI3_CHIPU|nr:hypothetical protein [Chiloscyllium punctatum]
MFGLLWNSQQTASFFYLSEDSIDRCRVQLDSQGDVTKQDKSDGYKCMQTYFVVFPEEKGISLAECHLGQTETSHKGL